MQHITFISHEMASCCKCRIRSSRSFSVPPLVTYPSKVVFVCPTSCSFFSVPVSYHREPKNALPPLQRLFPTNMAAQAEAPQVIAVHLTDEPRKAEERLEHYHPEHHHFYEPNKAHTGKRLLRIVIAGTGFLSDSYDLFVINIGKSSHC